MKVPKIGPRVPYIPSPYLSTLRAIQTPIAKVPRPIVVARNAPPSIWDRPQYDSEKRRRRLLAGGDVEGPVSRDVNANGESSVALGGHRRGSEIGGIGKAVPFFKDETHRGPTRALYRALMRSCRRPTALGNVEEIGRPDGSTAPTRAGQTGSYGGVRAQIRFDWRKRRHVTSIPIARTFLESQYNLHTFLYTAPASDIRKLENEIRTSSRPSSSPRIDTAIPETPKGAVQSSRPRLTGGFMRPTALNRPLPRLRPQPLSLSMMIKKRVIARQRQYLVRRDIANLKEDMRAETAFWKSLVDQDASLPGHVGIRHKAEAKRGKGLNEAEVQKWSIGWNRDAVDVLKDIDARLQVGWDMKEKKYDEGLIRRVMKAKRRRQAFLKARAEAAKVSPTATT